MLNSFQHPFRHLSRTVFHVFHPVGLWCANQPGFTLFWKLLRSFISLGGITARQ